MSLATPRAAHFADMVDSHLQEVLRSQDWVPNLHEVLEYSLGLDLADRKARGKRIRPVLCLMTAEALGADPAKALGFAAAIELMHNFALVHDDIEDGDTVRRDRPCAHLRFGLAHGVNAGDYFLCKVYGVLLADKVLEPATRLRLLQLMTDTLDHTIIGQALDISARSSRRFTMTEYLRLVGEKTGYYLAAPLLGGAIVAGAADSTLDALTQFGRAIGPLFQIVDDLIDLTEGKGRGGSLGNDIREGKRSFLVAWAAERLDPAARERLYDILDAPRESTSDADVAEAIGLFRQSGAFEGAQAKCRELEAEGMAALQGLPARLREALEAVTRELGRRKN